jgi:hypothetical protein
MLEVPIFKQFHKNIIGRGGSTIKKVRNDSLEISSSYINNDGKILLKGLRKIMIPS